MGCSPLPLTPSVPDADAADASPVHSSGAPSRHSAVRGQLDKCTSAASGRAPSPDGRTTETTARRMRIGGGLAVALLPLLLSLLLSVDSAAIVKRSYSDQSVRGYLTERACWWNEICKEEFQTQFRCKCPQWSYCRSPGRYYNAYCTVTGTGYIWTQPGWGGSAAAAAASGT